jgi:hypothetical protein
MSMAARSLSIPSASAKDVTPTNTKAAANWRLVPMKEISDNVTTVQCQTNVRFGSHADLDCLVSAKSGHWFAHGDALLRYRVQI